jgi:hypothetical protein
MVGLSLDTRIVKYHAHQIEGPCAMAGLFQTNDHRLIALQAMSLDVPEASLAHPADAVGRT